jgi:YHS domain-containing protein
MKRTKCLLIALLLAIWAAGTPALLADETQSGDKVKQTEPKAKPYPLKICVVSGDKLGEMGKPTLLVYKGQEMKFCCKDCIKDFKKDPDKYMKKLAEAVKKESAEKK